MADRARAAGPLSFESGDHRVEASLSTRARVEAWDAQGSQTDFFTALRSRVGLRYSFRERLSAFAEFQDARVNGLDDGASGVAALYRASAGGQSHAHGDRIRQLWLEARPRSGVALRLGRQDIKLGTEVRYAEETWTYLKGSRLGERLVGSVGWSHAERSNDGASASFDLGSHHLYAFAARPTTGVFDLNSSYAGQEGIGYGGLAWTAKRGAWLPDTEVQLFGLGYRDDRDVSDGGLSTAGDVEVYTAGFSLVGVRPVGRGSFDLLLWGAYQWGDWYALDHRGYAALLEAGYEMKDAPGSPWIRAGLNLGSGDRSPNDGDHESFFNVLPTNHIYYGYADQFALANLVNYFAQLRLKPLAKVGVEVFLHQLQLFSSDDGRHFGSGAFNKSSFGFGIQPSGGHRSAGTEVDLVVSYSPHARIALQVGYSFLEGHSIYNDLPDDDLRFAFFQVSTSY
jgi:hypothetical protein